MRTTCRGAAVALVTTGRSRPHTFSGDPRASSGRGGVVVRRDDAYGGIVGGILAGSTALVTGGARRIGRTISLALASAGANFVIHHRSSGGEARSLAEEIGRLGVEGATVQADLEQPSEAEALVDRARQLAGPLEILVNNASIFGRDTLETAAFERLSWPLLSCSPAPGRRSPQSRDRFRRTRWSRW